MGVILKVVERFSLGIDDNFEFLREVFDKENVEIFDGVGFLIKIVGKNVLSNDFLDKGLREGNDVFFKEFLDRI